MCDGLTWSFDVITTIAWLDLIKTLAPVITAFIAWRALQNWRRQDKAKRQADYLDQLTEAVQDFISKMPTPLTHVDFIKIGMVSYVTRERMNSDPVIANAIEYITRNGTDNGKSLMEALETARPVVTRVRALAAKGNVFKFQNYEMCQNDLAILVWQFDRMQGLAAFIRNAHWHWENEEVIGQLKKIMAIEPDEIREHLNSRNASIINFVGQTYSHIYD